ncbi:MULTISPECIES: TadE family protein [Clostridia]|uniref:TadE family protein n=1 Tax=Clostridia TaxID=186801 RepID=UPI000EB04872|nr:MULTISPECIES: TadE family protein [Clostridia]RKQ30339.1 pilus assembly protein [Ruminococcus sp. B05]TAP33849.1 pilus assembly protein [Mediterraneibacter sp. gm002]
MGRIKKYQEVQGVITVEMAYLMPIIFMVFVLVVYTAFYYHDKQILIGAAAETTTVGAQQKR